MNYQVLLTEMLQGTLMTLRNFLFYLGICAALGPSGFLRPYV